MHAMETDRRAFKGLWPSIAAAQLVVIGVLAAWFAFGWKPAPISDWLLYWDTAGNPDRYERGGLGLWLLALPKSLGAPAHAASFVLNLLAATSLCAVAYRADRTRWRLFAQTMMGYLLLVTPYFGIVQLDLLGTAALVGGMWLLLESVERDRVRVAQFGCALLALTLAVSTRPQFALILWALVGLIGVAMLVWRQWRTRRMALIAAGLLLGSIVGFCVDMGMRQISGRTEQIRTSSAVTLYAGLLVSSDRRDQGCGYWSVEAGQAAREDLHMSMWDAANGRLAARPPEHWGRVLLCKAPQIVSPPAYALYWFAEAPNLAEWRNQHPDRVDVERFQAKAYAVERRLYRALGMIILLVALATAIKAVRARRWDAPLLLAGWITAFWAVHMVFEIQGRYFVGFYLMLPVLCAMFWSRRSHGGDRRGGRQGATLS